MTTRIVAGQARGRVLRTPQGQRTRPTSSRVREAIFSLLQTRLPIEDAVVLDLYAGSGALGLEALSRGAANAVLVESAHACCSVIEQNIALLGYAAKTELLNVSVPACVPRLRGRGQLFDLVLMDPPYAIDPWPTVEMLDSSELLQPSAVVVVEHAKGNESPACLGTLSLSLGRCYGDTVVSLYSRSIDPPRE